MSVEKNVSGQSLRRWSIRAACVAAYFALLVFLFVNGKGHTIIIDNKDSADGAHPALEFVSVAVDGGEPAEYYPGDRDKAAVKGQKHRVRLELADGTKIEKDISVPLSQDMVLLSVPLLAASAAGAIAPFTAADVAPPAAGESSGNVNEFTSPDAPPAPGAEQPPEPAAPAQK
jgi:hypothetical protein